jgi:hypothetical protein
VTEDTKLAWLLHYCGQGMRLHPVWEITEEGRCARGKPDCQPSNWGKHPRFHDWPNRASADPAQVTTWHRQWPSANWAWVQDVTFTLDVDPRNGGPEPDEFDGWWLNLAGFELPPTLTQSTGGGGLHLVFRQPPGQEVRSGKITSGVEVKGVGGYILVAPSNHRSGGTYQIHRWTPPAAPPSELLPVLKKKRTERDEEIAQDHESLDFDAWLGQGPTIDAGQREHLVRGIGWMRERGYSLASAVVLAWQVAQTYRNQDPTDPWSQDYVLGLVKDMYGRYPGGGLTPEQLEAVRRYQQKRPDPEFERKVAERMSIRRADRIARELLEREEAGDDNRVTRLVSLDELKAVERPDYLVDQVLPGVGLAMAFGMSGAGKSFVELDLALSVANGVESWFGWIIKHSGPAIYVLREGEWGFDRRVDAWLQAHPGCTQENLYILREGEELDLGSWASVERLIQDARGAKIQPAIIVVDTQGQATVGREENSNTDMNAVYRNCKRLAWELGCLVSLVHHTGWDVTRERGASAQRQAVDVVFGVQSDGRGAGIIRVEKRREGVVPETRYFQLTPTNGSAVATQVNPLSHAAAQLQRQVELLQEVIEMVGLLNQTEGAVAKNRIWTAIAERRREEHRTAPNKTLLNSIIDGALETGNTPLVNVGTPDRPLVQLRETG